MATLPPGKNAATVGPTAPRGAQGAAGRAPWWARKWPQRGLYALMIVVLGLGFMAYQSPDIRANWEAIAALCGF